MVKRRHRGSTCTGKPRFRGPAEGLRGRLVPLEAATNAQGRLVRWSSFQRQGGKQEPTSRPPPHGRLREGTPTACQ